MKFLCRLVGIFAGLAPLFAQGPLPPDTTGCTDSTALPRILRCRIDNCERKDWDQRRVPVREAVKGEPVTSAVDGESRSIMYECPADSSPETIVESALARLRLSGFSVLYRFVGMEGSITARKDYLWVLLEAASHYYTVTELKATPPDFESITDASEYADAIERYGHVPAYGIRFAPGNSELLAESNDALKEIAAMMEAHPDWRFRIESHSDNSASRMTNLTFTGRRASAVVTWLVNHGVKRLRLEQAGLGDTHPVADNATEEGRTKNDRIEFVKLTAH